MLFYNKLVREIKGIISCLQIIELFILGYVSYGLGERLNLTQLIKENFASDLYQHSLHDIPMMRDIFYLPEEIYDVKNTAKQKKLQQLARDSRDLIPVSKIISTNFRKTNRSSLSREIWIFKN
jgi:hypothetical protein